MLSVGNVFPYFELQGVDHNINMVNVTDDDLEGKWAVIYFYPKDFTFICPTEIAAMDEISRVCRVIGISGDNEFCKLAWKESNPMIANIQHVLAADCGLELSHGLGIVESGVCLRATFIIDPEGIIQHVSVNALDTGRNADEVLRTVQALQAGGLTGCNWQEGEDFVG